MSLTKFPVLLVVVALLQFRVVYTAVNSYDGHLHFECPHGYQYISHIESDHSNSKEDRVFSMSCSNVTSDVENPVVSCSWTDYVNAYDGLIAFQCDQNQYISGLQSDHNNHHEDRRWKVKCCGMHEIHLTDCKYTGWTNDWDKHQYFDSTFVTKGIVSIHNNDREDRLYEYEICEAYLSDGSILFGRR